MLAVRLLPHAFSLDREDGKGRQNSTRITAPLTSVIVHIADRGRAFLVLMGFTLVVIGLHILTRLADTPLQPQPGPPTPSPEPLILNPLYP